MSYNYRLDKRIGLYVDGRISKSDAARQMETAAAILKRLKTQPGMILADEVGMGKTFVALAVAASVATQNKGRRPVVVMVPPSLKEKWPQDFETFRERCVPPDLRERLQCARAENAVAFLKYLDDAPKDRKALIFLTHGAMNPQNRLQDGWVKLAVLQRTLHHKKNASALRSRIARWASPLLRMGCRHLAEEDWADLLDRTPNEWLDRLGDRIPDGDDPVPEAVIKVLNRVDTSDLRDAIERLPRRLSGNIDDRLADSRKEISACLRALWSDLLRSLKERLPLLILDEAHHLKNAQTRLASLFQVPEAKDDAEEFSEKGPMGGMFERMLFLTATPFQLGHHELCSVLERFKGICWKGRNAPPRGKEQFEQEVAALRSSMDDAQRCALRLEKEWGKLKATDMSCAGAKFAGVNAWWQAARQGGELAPTGETVRQRYREAEGNMRQAEALLHPWVIRHLRSRCLPEPFLNVPRRRRLSGAAITDGDSEGDRGITVSGNDLLPFLLAARAALCAPDERPVFAEGLASSYEAFLHTRRLHLQAARNRSYQAPTDVDDEDSGVPSVRGNAKWYLDQLERCVPSNDPLASASHPKVAGTVSQVVRLWQAGEKVLVFCHYIATGRSLRKAISNAINMRIQQDAVEQLGCTPAEVTRELDRIGARFDRDGSLGQACEKLVGPLIDRHASLEEHRSNLLDITRRFLRTPSFLVRFFPLRQASRRELLEKALSEGHDGRLPLTALLKGFFSFLHNHCDPQKRCAYVKALLSVQPGSHSAADIARTFTADELRGGTRESILPNVRLVNGDVRQDTRQRLMLTFNTPFYPEVLIASAVMAEGVDLHLNCQHVIHHDLCWNPSTLEQRTGRVDRIGAKAERCGSPIEIFLPYVAETQDEKMYRVVMDRERWFQVVMGEELRMDVRTTDAIAQRVPFPEKAASELAFRLEVAGCRDVQ